MTGVRARWIALDARTWIENGAIVVRGGRVASFHRNAAELAHVAIARTIDFGDALVAPGFVDAHAHLELSGLALATPASFADWIRALIAARGARAPDELGRDARAGADRLLATGTTVVGDIDATGAGATSLARHPLRRRVYREVLDGGDVARTAAVLESLERARTCRARDYSGIAPHAPYTLSPALFDALGRLARARHAWTSIHWAETREETAWLARGEGPLAALLRESPRASGLALIERAGLLGSRTLLVHGNEPEPGDLARVARCRASLAHCPGTHAFFARAPFDFDAARGAGVRLVLGTDGRSSNADLDMRREMALVRRAAPELDPADVLAMATSESAAALGFEGRAGVLHAGAWADFTVHSAAGVVTSDAWLEALTLAETAVSEVWIAGAPVHRASGEPSRAGPPA
ncbi:MAG: amidohydrolase family protein [Planctomycetota bacterium]